MHPTIYLAGPAVFEPDPHAIFATMKHALGKPLAGWTRETRLYPERVRDFSSDIFIEDLAVTAPTPGAALSALACDPDGILVHSETCLQNAMTAIGIARSGGEVHADPDWTAAFDRAVASLSALLSSRSRP